jgi:hypothetical protein
MMVGYFWKPYIKQVISGEWDLTKEIDNRGVGCCPIGGEHMIGEER